MTTSTSRTLAILSILLPIASWMPILVLAATGYGQGGGSMPYMAPIVNSLIAIVAGHVTGLILCLAVLVICHRRRTKPSRFIEAPVVYYLLVVIVVLIVVT